MTGHAGPRPRSRRARRSTERRRAVRPRPATAPTSGWSRNMFGYAVVHYEDVTGDPARQALAQRVGADPRADGRSPAEDFLDRQRGQHPVAPRATCTCGCAASSRRRSRREPPTGCARSCARSSTTSSTRSRRPGAPTSSSTSASRTRSRSSASCSVRRRSDWQLFSRLAERHPRDLLGRPGRQDRPRHGARRTSSTSTPGS